MYTHFTIKNVNIRCYDGSHRMVFADITDNITHIHFAIAEWLDLDNHIDRAYSNTVESALVDCYEIAHLPELFHELDECIDHLLENK